jgi:glycosyltransferase involved in cell wall biosynthesis
MVLSGGSATLTPPGSASQQLSRVLNALTRAHQRNEVPVLLGLPSDGASAQAMLDTLSRLHERSVILWERSGGTLTESTRGLQGLHALREIWVLNPALTSPTHQLFPDADLSTIGLALPQIFFEAHGGGSRPYAAFLGRFSAGKGAAVLARAWTREIFPDTGIPLVMAGRGLSSDLETENEVIELAREYPYAVRTTRLMSERSRARFLANALMAVFPSLHDYFPQALAETLASGTAVVATRIPGHEALAIHGETSVEVRQDLADLLDAIRLLQSDRQLATRLAINGRRSMYETQSSAAIGPRLVRLAS